MLELKNITSGYGKRVILRNISATFPSGQITSVIGNNGCGKSTLLKTLAGLIPCTDGEILIDGMPLSDISRQSVAKMISYLPQNRPIPEITVEQAVLYGRFPHLSYPRRYTQKDIFIAESAMEQAGVIGIRNQLLPTLSGGMLRNTYIAMALAQDTKYILLDEPTTHLDISNCLRLTNTMKQLAECGKGIVVVLHDIISAMEFSQKIVLMDNGNIITSDTPENLFRTSEISRIFGIKLSRHHTENGYIYYYEN